MKFYLGMHHPSDAHRVDLACVSYRAIKKRKSDFRPARFGWILDSGAFRELALHGAYQDEPDAYAEGAARWARIGKLDAVVSQDYMCEPFMLAKTGLTVADHQRLTIERFEALRAAWRARGGDPCSLMPVLQGWTVRDYQNHVHDYGKRLERYAWVGVGSVCKRQGAIGLVEDILCSIKEVRPDLRLHGFGVKVTALESPLIRRLLYSADSMAWSFAARMEGRDANDHREALAFAERINTPLFGSEQLSLFAPKIAVAGAPKQPDEPGAARHTNDRPEQLEKIVGPAEPSLKAKTKAGPANKGPPRNATGIRSHAAGNLQPASLSI